LAVVREVFRARRRKNRQLRDITAGRKMAEYLLLKLRKIAAGDDGDLLDIEQAA
jgi:hypothetical protein